VARLRQQERLLSPSSDPIPSADERLRRVLLAAFVVGLALSITVAESALALLALRFVVRLVSGRVQRGWPLGLAFAAWVAVSLLSALLSSRPGASLMTAKTVLLIATFYVLLDALADRAELERWGRWLFWLLAAVAVVGVFQVTLCPWLVGVEPMLRVARKCQRARAFYSIYMTLAGVLSMIVLASLPVLLVLPRASARWGVLGWLASGAGLVATYVRGAWIGFLAGIAVLLGLTPRRRWLVVAGAAAVAMLVVLAPGLRQRAESILDPSDPTVRERWAMWASAVQMARDYPLIGVGPGGVRREYPRYAAPEYREKPRGHFHNTPLQILVERGVLGLAAWLAIFVAFFWRAQAVLRALGPQAARERALVAGSVAAIAGFLVGGLTEYNFGDSEVVLLAYAVMTVPFVVAREVPNRPAS
jgi:putative inorganic carbon (hco3(-)) transporter